MTLPTVTFTELYVQTTGSNLNAGSTTTDAALATYTSSAVLGWNSGTGVFEVASGDPVADGVTVGMFASIYVTSGATVATFIARITAVSSTAVTVSLTAKSGTAPSTDTAGLTTMKVGGAHKGPNGAVSFPLGFTAATQTDASSHVPRVNIKNGVTYSVTAAMTHGVAGPIVFQGYTATPGDGGLAVIDGGSAGASYALLTLSQNRATLADIILQNNGATGSADGLTVSGGFSRIARVVVSGIRRQGIRLSGNSALIQCEAFDCNKSNSAGFSGIGVLSSGASATRCISHHNTSGTAGHGFAASSSGVFKDCIAWKNSGNGFLDTTDGVRAYINCDAYDNTLSNFNFAGGTVVSETTLEDCNSFKAGQYDFVFAGGGTIGRIGVMLNCAVGSGTKASGSGIVSKTEPCGMLEIGCKQFAANATPWNDPDNGDFRVALTAARGKARGGFTISKSGYGPTLGYEDLGAAQALHT